MSVLATKFGGTDAAAVPNAPLNAPAASNGAVTTSTTGSARLFSPDSPKFWLFGIGLAMFGLIAVSTSVRVGPVRLAGSVGKRA